MLVSVPVSIGELVDKITILEIKQELITDPDKLKNINHELLLLKKIKDSLDIPITVSVFEVMLKDTNRYLWDIEDGKRACEAKKDFGEDFVKLSRALYVNNDLRGTIKRKINEIAGSEIVEEKMYTTYKNDSEKI